MSMLIQKFNELMQDPEFRKEYEAVRQDGKMDRESQPTDIEMAGGAEGDVL